MERTYYPLHDTRGVLLIQGVGALLSLTVAVPMVLAFGTQGTAWASSIYFGLQLMLAASRARRASRRRDAVTTERGAGYAGGVYYA